MDGFDFGSFEILVAFLVMQQRIRCQRVGWFGRVMSEITFKIR